ncbi:serine protease Do [Thermosyntropha lipolytica DSM 11003]|uniref:Serine protease Do n=1 Tax=Thermosyntropha lipolytica DSM 11003 TaxID=1123382 RepID=A0A1M5R5D4_9FIRM|nr:trypsin-like peptidase domain-containing protein [Thermosyntropha lipolytica]SHH21296.1 serine protease Do [Thermosyntropha lipolytica DSM 11003]
MKKETAKGLLLFTICFFLGWGAFAFINYYLAGASKPTAGDPSLLSDGRISDVARWVSPSVVGITSLKSEDDIFNHRTVESTGSGVILDHQGYIVTNHHVIKGAQKIIVTLADGNEEEAKIIGVDPKTDLALVKVKVDNHVTPIAFGDSDKLEVGQQVVAIGNPLGLRFARSVTAGIISGLNRLLTTEEGFPFRLIQTDAAINPGNSGGALVNLKGELIGINTIKIAAEGFEGMGFAIPSNQVKRVVEDLKKYGEVKRPVIGIRILSDFSCDAAYFFRLPVDCGVAVNPVPGGPAARAGMRKYDIITRVDGEKIESGLDLQERIYRKNIGDKVEVEFIRMPANKGEKVQLYTVTITLEED